MTNSYPAYKPSGVDWLGDVPTHWDVKKLKYIGQSIIGITYSPDDISNNEEGLLVLRASNIQEGRLALDDCVYVKKVIPNNQITKHGDILLCARNGSRELVGKNICIRANAVGMTFGAFMVVVRTNYWPFIYWFFNSNIFKSQSGLFSTSTINQLTNDTLNNMVVAYPQSHTEQTAIADYLDTQTARLDTLIGQKRQLVALLQEERAGLINDAVTQGLNARVPRKDSGLPWLGKIPAHWEVKKLKYVVEGVLGGGTPSTTEKAYWNGEIPWVSPKDMKVELISSTQDYVTELALQNSATTLIPAGSVLIVVRSGILKHTFPVAINTVEVTLNQDMKAIIPITGLSNQYLKWLLKGMQKSILTYCSKLGATVDSIETEALFNFTFSYPPLSEQSEIVSYLDAETARIDTTIQTVEEEIALVTEYRSALISEVVTGKVKVS